jgi:hypothetical protein
MDKRILFSLFVLVGNITVAISINYSLGVAHVAEYVALFTSVSTAIYAILAQPKERTEPLLRITPTLERHPVVFIDNRKFGGSVGLDVRIQNIGYSIAKDIEIRCQLIPHASIHLENNGIYKISLLSPRDPPIKYQVVGGADAEKLLLLTLAIEVSYLNEDDKKQKPIKKVCWVKELNQEG